MKKILILIAVVAIGAFAWWTISPFFIDTVVEDELDPAIAALLEVEDTTITTHDTLTPITNEPAEIPANETPEVGSVIEAPTETTTPEPDTTPQPIVRGPFAIADTPGHPATGNIRVIETAEETLVRYENYDGTNGPDLKVYLTNDLEEASDFVSLGAARGNQGNINYKVPNDVNVNDFKYVVTWCEAFGVLFDYAEIN